MRTASASLVAIVSLVLACGSASGPSPADDGAPKGQQLYKMHCELCHGANGKLGFNGAKDLTASTLSRAEMVAQVSNGKGRMMPYKNTLSIKEIEAVVDYARALGNKR
ncbi:MAG: cytochrome c [Flavobacteriales bacterium]|jgi:mono/diheme cytochrome c family protein|nr:cytochrome c [Flavobacteriales bacterium]